jgi:peroxiredoxin
VLDVLINSYDFKLPDNLGGFYQLSSALKAGPVVVVFIRGHWCPYCRRYLCKLQTHLPRLAELGASVVAISPEAPEISAHLARELKLDFPIVADSDGKIIERFGVRNSFSSARSLLPHPAVFIFSQAAQPLFSSIDRNYKKRTTMRSITQALIASNEGRLAVG